MWNEFKKFALRGSLVDLTIGFIIGTAFSKVVTSIVNDLIMPPLGLLIGHVDFSALYINLSRTPYPSYQAAQAANAPIINIGAFLTTVVNFFIIAVVMFIVVRQFNRLSQIRKRKEPPTVVARKCPYCYTDIAEEATRCPHCTSHLPKIEMTSR